MLQKWGFFCNEDITFPFNKKETDQKSFFENPPGISC